MKQQLAFAVAVPGVVGQDVGTHTPIRRWYRLDARWLLLIAIVIAISAALLLTGGSPMRIYDSFIWLGIQVPALQPAAWAVAIWIHHTFLPNYYLVP
jgi:hypothetical protein